MFKDTVPEEKKTIYMGRILKLSSTVLKVKINIYIISNLTMYSLKKNLLFAPLNTNKYIMLHLYGTYLATV